MDYFVAIKPLFWIETNFQSKEKIRKHTPFCRQILHEDMGGLVPVCL